MAITRREFIKGIAALAVLAKVPGLSEKTQIKKFMEEAATGLVEGKTFMLDAPIGLCNIQNLTIRNCSFIAKRDFGGALLYIDKDCENLIITDCYFKTANPGLLFG